MLALHPNSQIPVKKSKLHPLSQEQKASHSKLSRKRILIENIIRKLKIFRILSERYRNRRKRFSLRFNLIAAIYNMELKTTPNLLMQEVYYMDWILEANKHIYTDRQPACWL